MNKLLICFLLFICFPSIAQDINYAPPEYQGGSESFYKYIADNFKIPDYVAKAKTRGVVFVEFYITKNGNIDSISVWNGVHKELEKQAIQLLKETDGKWIPATKDGIPVGVKILSAFFTIDTGESLYSYEEQYKIYHDKAENSYTKEKYKKAIKNYLQCINLKPLVMENYAKLGICYKNLGELELSKLYSDRSQRLSGHTIQRN